MKRIKLFTLFVGLALLVSACRGTSAATPPATPTPTMEPNMPGMDMSGQMLPTAMPGQMTPTEMPGAGADTGEGMGGMAMEGPVSSKGVPLATETLGGQPLAYTQAGEVKVFALTARPVRWPILKDVYVTAWTYNGAVPGPMIRVREGDQVRITLKNELPEATSIHWHGLPVPNNMDGVPPFTQKAIEPGETFTYEFAAAPAGTFMYHSHVNTDQQIMLGLYAPFIIDSKTPETVKPAVDEMLMLSEWTIGPDGETYPTMPMAGREPNYFTINGKSFPETQSITVKVGEVVRLRLAAIGQFTHPMHLHGVSFKVVAIDGNPVPEAAQLTRDTIAVNPGERYDIEFAFTNPGTWVFHCHVLHHVTNNNVEPGGLIYVINVEA
jgi:FtsP/CotA-like multicopper oxidase with cupredoxin domain